jgi:hypothetical protein
MPQHSVVATRGIYVSEDSGRLNQTVFGYRERNHKNKSPICSLDTGASGNVSVDGKGNVMVATGDGGTSLYVFQGPGMCGAEVGEIPTNSASVDAASNDAASGEIIVGNFQTFNPSGNGDVQICTLAAGCTVSLTNPNMFEVVGVALAKNGDCWASAYGQGSNATLTYFRHCAGVGEPATGFENKAPGGLDIDRNGHLVSIDQQVGQGLYVYKGCNPRCTVIGGPFPLKGGTSYGHLNEDSTMFVGADFQYGQADVYAYTPRKLRYRYSFTNGLSQTNGVVGAAYNPRSRQ